MTRTLIVAAAIAALGLASCGKVGTLEQPAPLYGAKAKADYRARKAAAAEAAAQQRRDDAEIESLPPDKPYDPNADPSSSRYLPIPGAPAAPNAPPPQGVLPDPYNHPQ
jgi:hypothetical protein